MGIWEIMRKHLETKLNANYNYFQLTNFTYHEL